MKIAGVLLAAGTSSRLGQNKLLVRLGGVSVLRRAAQAALDADLAPLIAVVGHEAALARAELPCAAIENPRYAEGMNTSLACGIAALPEDVDAAVVLLADMPLVTAELIRAVAARWQGEPLVLSTYGAVAAPPILYARRLFPELRALAPDADGKAVVRRHRAQAAEVPQPEGALRDLDTPEDLEALK